MADGIDIADLERQILRTGKKLDVMEAKVQKKILRKSIRAAAAPFVKGLRTNAPSDEKDLKRTMGLQVTTDASRGLVIAMAGQSKAKRKRRGAVQIHVVDQDTKPHSITGSFMSRSGELIKGTFQHPGTRGDEFVERTAKQKQAESLRIFAAKTAAEVEAEAGKV
jgi:hypothetical protein|tara:strand:+ start:2127 stop:2621 length:495 start_codon:yes stop_codon:yes gene_type:complete